MRAIYYLVLGVFFGILMYKSEAASWFRINEMFNFESFHMYGLMGVAAVVGIAGVQIIKRFNIKDFRGNPIEFSDKDMSIPRYLIGGILFGLGWGLAGACPGPMFVLAGAGYLPLLVVIVGALIGTYAYGIFRDKLPH